jgi:Rha family phage regulatory protein
MNTQSPATPELRPELTIIDGKIKTTSVAIAQHFNKRHDNVIRAIKNINCSPEFNALNFEEVEYTDAKGEKHPAYEMTRDGFTFLAMGFTGAKAAQWKEAYITAFNRMEAELQGLPSQELPKPEKPRITHILTTLHDGHAVYEEVVSEKMRVVCITNVESFCDFILHTMPMEFAPEVFKVLAKKVIGSRVVGGPQNFTGKAG